MRRSTFLVHLLATAAVGSIAAPAQPPFAEVNGWHFRNFNTDPAAITPELYRETFLGVGKNLDEFQLLFFETAYREALSQGGNCVGMSVMALLLSERGGYLGFCAPASHYDGTIGPTDTGLRHVIHLLHGQQVGVPFLEQVTHLINEGISQNGRMAWDLAKDYLTVGDPCIVSLTRSANPVGGAHTMVVDRLGDLGQGVKAIYVYDPNHEWTAAEPDNPKLITCDGVPHIRYNAADWYRQGLNRIVIQQHGSWEYAPRDCSNRVYKGGPASAHIFITPLSVAGYKARSVGGLGAAAVSHLKMVVSGDGSSLRQVTDGAGKRMFVPGTSRLDTDPGTGMRNVAPFFPSDGDGYRNGDAPTYFLLGERTGRLEVEVECGAAGYVLDLAGPDGHAVVAARGGEGSDIVTIEQAGSARTAVRLRNSAETDDYRVELHCRMRRGVTQTFRVSNLNVPSEGDVKVRLLFEDEALAVDSPGARIGYDVEVQRTTAAGATTAARRGLVVEAGRAQRVRPRDWLDVRTEELEVRDLLRSRR